jgi:hypothetical protein
LELLQRKVIVRTLRDDRPMCAELGESAAKWVALNGSQLLSDKMAELLRLIFLR